jgi:alpha-1,3/alpha-1,6-mannosyltransferase
MRIAFLHPDLGIGGAERLIIDAALGLQQRSHEVTMYTSHYDPDRCFVESKLLNVVVRGNWNVPRWFRIGKLPIAIMKNLWLSLWLVAKVLWQNEIVDVFVVDQLSVSIPLLRITGVKVLFYCHFPDKLLSPRKSILKQIYRLPLDLVEEITTRTIPETACIDIVRTSGQDCGK